MIPSYDIKKTASFFTELFSFKLEMSEPSYIILSKDKLTIHLLNAGEDIGQMEFYLEVDNINSLWESIKDKLNGIKVREPFNRDYGMREFHIEVPHTKTLMFVGQAL